MTAQADRDRLVSAFLDLTLEQWEGWVRGLSDAEVADLERDGLDQFAVGVIESLRSDEPAAQAAYLQTMAQLADATMRDFVRWVSGRDPLGDVEVPR